MIAATIQDLDAIEEFFNLVIDDQEGKEESPMWIKGVYPNREYMKNAIDNGEMFIIKEKDKVLAALVLNHDQNHGYEQVEWEVNCSDDKIQVFHTFAVLPECRGKGYARRCMEWVKQEAASRKMKSIRFDVIGPNKPAMRFYEHLGFVFRGWARFAYEDCGMQDFALYEYVV